MRMLTCFLLCVGVSLTALSQTVERAPNTVVPRWSVGDKWTVRTWLDAGSIPGDGRPRTYRKKALALDVPFEVVDTETVRDVPCLHVRMVFPKEGRGFERRIELFFAEKSSKLIRVIDDSNRGDGTIKNEVFDYSTDPSLPVDASEVLSMIPLSFPAFAQAGATNQPKEKPDVAQSAVLNADNKSYTVTIGKDLKAEKGPKVEQVWEPGLPWYKSAKTYRNGEVVTEAELVTDKKP